MKQRWVQLRVQLCSNRAGDLVVAVVAPSLIGSSRSHNWLRLSSQTRSPSSSSSSFLLLLLGQLRIIASLQRYINKCRTPQREKRNAGQRRFSAPGRHRARPVAPIGPHVHFEQSIQQFVQVVVNKADAGFKRRLHLQKAGSEKILPKEEETCFFPSCGSLQKRLNAQTTFNDLQK